ncbi:hypothetical protein WJ438_37315 [Streptomyces sp. GD-15H]|uniref:hypothetical protein n=1 Tax=Streptomyces sp. GD-15H TaxID=3129112 RepID=UPI00325559E8
MEVCERILRRALDGRPPSERTVRAFTLGSGADPEKAARLRERAVRVLRPRPVPVRPVRAGTDHQLGGCLARAMQRLRAEANNPSLDVLTEAGQGRFSRGALPHALSGRRLPSEELLIGFAAACGISEETEQALLAARRRILAGPRGLEGYPCGIAERANERRQQDETARPWLAGTGPELDRYDQQLRNAEEAETGRMIVWVDSLT